MLTATDRSEQVRIEVARFEPRVTAGVYVMSHLEQTHLVAKRLRITLPNGDCGWGEAVASPVLQPQERSRREDLALDALSGLALHQITKTVRDWQQDPWLRGLAFGLETAIADMAARRAGISLSEFLGGPPSGDVPAYFFFSGDQGAPASDRARLARDYPVVQVKLGLNRLRQDLDLIAELLAHLCDDQVLLADFNGALDPKEEVDLRSVPDDPRLIWEEPCSSVSDNAMLAQMGLPILFDQCLKTIDDFRAAIASGAKAVAIKPMILGGLEIGRAARDLCAEHRVLMRIDGTLSGQIATAAAVHLAIGAPTDLLLASGDLTAPLTTGREMLVHGRGKIGVRPGPGLGPIPASVDHAEWMPID